MTLRTRLNLAVAALIIVHLISAAFALRAVSRNAENTNLYMRMRESGQLAADIRTDIYNRLARASGAETPLKEPRSIDWPRYALDDIEVQIRLAESEFERTHWAGLRHAIVAMSEAQAMAGTMEDMEILREAEHHIRALRNDFGERESKAIAAAALTGLEARMAISIAVGLTVVLFLIYLFIVGRWLVRPIEALKTSADILATGRLSHRVTVDGKSELSDLGRRFNMMAQSLKRHQKELVESRELSAIGELCTNVAHGLRNPLASLRASAQLAGRRAGDAEETKLSLLEIVRQVDRLDERISRLFEFSRPCRVDAAPTTFLELADQVREEVKGLTQSHGVSFMVEDRTDGTRCLLDRTQLVGAIAELVANATVHCGDEGHVIFRGEQASGQGGDGGHCWRLQVTDDGCGMTEEVKARAFDLFFTSRVAGTGMGLAMVRRAVQRHGGRVRIESEPGHGTVITVEIPMSPEGGSAIGPASQGESVVPSSGWRSGN